MSVSEVLQLAALVVLPLGILLVLMAIHSLLLGVGFAMVCAALELWFVGRELDLQGGDET